MATVTMSALDFLDDYLRPLAEALDAPLPPVLGVKPTPAMAAFNTFRSAIALVPGAGAPRSITIPDIPAPPSPGDLVPAPPPASALQPIAPTDALREVAKAVRDAEAILNDSNLAIADASAEVRLLVSVGGLAGAEATISVKISPTSEPIPKDQS